MSLHQKIAGSTHTLAIKNPTVGFDRHTGALTGIHFEVQIDTQMFSMLRLDAQGTTAVMQRLHAVTMDDLARLGRAVVRINGCAIHLVNIIGRDEN